MYSTMYKMFLRVNANSMCDIWINEKLKKQNKDKREKEKKEINFVTNNLLERFVNEKILRS